MLGAASYGYLGDTFNTITYKRDHNGIVWVYGDPGQSRGGGRGWIPETALHGAGTC